MSSDEVVGNGDGIGVNGIEGEGDGAEIVCKEVDTRVGALLLDLAGPRECGWVEDAGTGARGNDLYAKGF